MEVEAVTAGAFIILAIVVALLALRIFVRWHLDRDTFPHKPPRW